MSYNDSPLRDLLEPDLSPTVPDSVSRRQARHDELAARVDSGIDPDYIAQFENFHSMEHAEIYQLTRTISPEAMNTLAREWAKLGFTFSSSIALGTAMIRDKIAQHWEGDAATAAASATQLFGTSAQQLCDAAGAVSQKLRIAAEVGERVKSSIDPPTTSIPVLADVVNPASGADAARAAEAARAQAVRVMETLYKPYYRDSGSAVPTLPSPYAATTPSTGTAGTNPFGSSQGSGGAGASAMEGFADGTRRTGGAEVADAATDAHGADRYGSDPYGSDPYGAEPTPQEAAGASNRSTFPEDAATQPASTSPTASQGGTTTTSQPYGSSTSGLASPGGGYAGAGPYGGGGGVGSGASLGSGAMGGVAQGGLAAGSAPAAAQQGVAGARSGGVRPMGMVPGMMGGGAQPGNDEERRVASYLVTNDNGNELIGSMPDTAPPVFGVDPV